MEPPASISVFIREHPVKRGCGATARGGETVVPLAPGAGAQGFGGFWMAGRPSKDLEIVEPNITPSHYLVLNLRGGGL